MPAPAPPPEPRGSWPHCPGPGLRQHLLCGSSGAAGTHPRPQGAALSPQERDARGCWGSDQGLQEKAPAAQESEGETPPSPEGANPARSPGMQWAPKARQETDLKPLQLPSKSGIEHPSFIHSTRMLSLGPGGWAQRWTREGLPSTCPQPVADTSRNKRPYPGCQEPARSMLSQCRAQGPAHSRCFIHRGVWTKCRGLRAQREGLQGSRPQLPRHEGTG